MIKSGSHPFAAAIGARTPFMSRFKWLFVFMIAGLLAMSARPDSTTDDSTQQSPDEQYIQIMTLIDKADTLRVKGQADAAKAKYKQAEAELLAFKRNNPLFLPKTVAYRINELTARIETRPPVKEVTTPAPAPKKATPKPAAAPTVLESDNSVAASPTTVKLLEAGAEPKKMLRFHVKPGDKQTLVLNFKMNMGAPAAGNRGGVPKIPAFYFPIDMTVKSVEANGDIHYESVMGDPGIMDEASVQPQMAKALKSSLGGLKGVTVNGIISDRGINKKADVQAPAGADAQVRKMVDQMKDGISNMDSPLPEEAVGVGAKWEVAKPVRSQGITMDSTTTYQLASLDGDHVGTSFTVNQSAKDQTVENAMGGGAQVHLSKMTSTGSGTRTGDLSKLGPTQATFDMHMDMTSEINMNGKNMPMDMKMDMNFSIESR
jgi:hypothetical protein